MHDSPSDAAPRVCVEARGTGTAPTDRWMASGGRSARMTVLREGCLRQYRLESEGPGRENFPDNPRQIEERAEWPRLRTRNDLLDGLYAMALEETRENSVPAIRDGAFERGAPLPCPTGGCFETGRLWTYVWTRDTAYSVHLGLGALDPTRALNSLSFKLSPRRDGSNEQIVQDTGTGGSYPVSTDRVAWTLGATALIPWLDNDVRRTFTERAYFAIKNTVDHDRNVVFDSETGLYFGEHSFLDWREQSYAGFTATDNALLATSRSLSTNALHWAALDFVAREAMTRGDAPAATRYAGYRDALRAAIRQRFWLNDVRNVSAYSSTALDPSAVRRWDLLGTSLVVSLGILAPDEARDAIANYPITGDGPAVLWPQQQQVAIYHNRGSWPFVTAFLLRAARDVRNDRVATRAMRSLIQSAALLRTNAENFEFVTGNPRLEDGAATGPVVNSARQLWSVAGYVSSVQDVLFGVTPQGNSLTFRPYVTREIRRTLLANTDSMVLDGLRVRGRTLTLEVLLPAVTADTAGAYQVGAITVDGAAVAGPIDLASLTTSGTHRVQIALEDRAEPASRETFATDTSDYRQLFGPRTPVISGMGLTPDSTRVRLTLDRAGEEASAVRFDVFRDGVRVAQDLDGSRATWDDPDPSTLRTQTHCYTVAMRFASSNNYSQHAAPQCFWGEDSRHVQSYLGFDFTAVGGTRGASNGRAFYGSWGDEGHTLTVPYLRPNATGPHLIQLEYSNGAGGFTTGITCAVKRVVIEELEGGREVASRVIAMPHTADWDSYRGSTFVRAELRADRAYRLRIDNSNDAINMSSLSHFARYTGGNGGMAGVYNRVNISAVRVLPLSGLPAGGTSVALNGDRDADDFATTQRVTPGIGYDTWDRFALDWDDGYVYLALSSPAFETTTSRPLVLYLQPSGATLAPQGAPRAGLTYSGQTATSPFAAEYAILLRRQSDAGDGAGPFNGIFRWDGAQWQRAYRFVQGRDFWVGSDSNRTLSVRVARAQLGLPLQLRFAGHVVTGGNNYNDVLPSTHQPWMATATAGFYELDLRGSHAVSAWRVR